MVEGMAVDWKVESVEGGEPRPWKSKQGQENLSYRVRLEGQEGPVEVSRWATKPGPKPGEEIYGYLQEDAEGKYPPKFRSVKRDGGFGGGNESPEKQKSIFMQHAQKEAHRILTFLHSAGLTTFADTKDYWQKFDMTVEILHKKAGK